jgi:hypothetical protein
VLFASAVLLAFLWGGGTEQTHRRALAGLAPAQVIVDLSARPTPLNLVRRPPVELKSFKIVGATGVGAFVPVDTDVALGAGVSTFRVGPGHCAMQFVAGVRFRF